MFRRAEEPLNKTTWMGNRNAAATSWSFEANEGPVTGWNP